MKTVAAVLLSVLILLGIIVGTGLTPANGQGEEKSEAKAGEFEMTFSSTPRFPVVGEGAELTFRVSQDGSPVEGLRVMVMVARAKEEDQGHAHGVEAQAEEEAETVTLTAKEVSPGVYVAKHTFVGGGKYATMAHIGEEAEEFAVAVRSRPVAWPLMIGLVALTVGVTGVVAVRKTLKREW